MKKITLILVATILALTTACSKSSQLKTAIAVANKQCPMVIDEGVVCTEITVENDNRIVYVCQMDEPDDFTVCDFNTPLVKMLMKETMSEYLTTQSNSDTKEIVELIKELKGSIVYRFIGTTSGCKSDVSINHTDL